MLMNIEYRVTINELADMVGASEASVRTWISSYRFNSFVFYDNALSEKPKLNVLVNSEFCKEFIPYLSLKDAKKKKKYVKTFSKSISAINLM